MHKENYTTNKLRQEKTRQSTNRLSRDNLTSPNINNINNIKLKLKNEQTNHKIEEN